MIDVKNATLNVDIAIEKGQSPFGQWSKQTLSLLQIQMQTNEEKHEEFTTLSNKSSSEQITTATAFKNMTLPINQSFITRVNLYNKLNLEGMQFICKLN